MGLSSICTYSYEMKIFLFQISSILDYPSIYWLIFSECKRWSFQISQGQLVATKSAPPPQWNCTEALSSFWKPNLHLFESHHLEVFAVISSQLIRWNYDHFVYIQDCFKFWSRLHVVDSYFERETLIRRLLRSFPISLICVQVWPILSWNLFYVDYDRIFRFPMKYDRIAF